MKQITIIFALLVLIGAGCSSSETENIEHTYPVADFEATVGTGIAPDNLTEDKNGPWNRRMMTATSEDGLTWTRTNTVVADQANAPDIVVDENGWLWMYYIGWTIGDRQNDAAVAISTDQGETWAHKYVEFEGVDHAFADPTVLYMDDGTFRMYGAYMDPDNGYISIHLAESTDGITFTYIGEVFNPGSEVNVPNIIDMGYWYQFFASVNYSSESWIANSFDGIEFISIFKDIFAIDGSAQRFSNGLAVDGGFRIYLYDPQKGVINSAFTADGVKWSTDEGYRLELDESSRQESAFVKDPAVVRLEDGSYLMVYVTVIPE